MPTPLEDIDSNILTFQTELIKKSYLRLLSKKLHSESSTKALYETDLIVLAHDGKSDPCFTYANKGAQSLWKINWQDFIGMPSKYSAEPDQRESRSKMLSETLEKGYYENYSGVRVSKEGKRFFIKKATIFNLIDDEGLRIGQAAVFNDWHYID